MTRRCPVLTSTVTAISGDRLTSVLSTISVVSIAAPSAATFLNRSTARYAQQNGASCSVWVLSVHRMSAASLGQELERGIGRGRGGSLLSDLESSGGSADGGGAESAADDAASSLSRRRSSSLGEMG